MSKFDLVIIGGGPGGYVAALRAAQLGFSVACIEKRKALGGTCLNVGCIPSKALLDSSEHFYFAQHKLARHGIIASDVKLNLDVMIQRKETVVRSLTQGIAGLFKKNKIQYLQGHGRLLSNNQVEILDDSGKVGSTLEATRILLATGSDVIEIPTAPFDGESIVSSTEALSFPQVPKHLVVIGGGVIGLELGSVWCRLGARVTVVEASDALVSSMDRQISLELKKILEKQGLQFKLSTKLLKTEKKPNGSVVLHLSTQETLEADRVLVAVGRKPYTQNLGLEKAGVKLDERGRVIIDDHFQTTTKGIYAVGDIVRGPMLAHKAEDEGVAVAEIMAGQKPHVNYHTIPGVVYTWPEVASVGYTQEEAQAQGLPLKIGTFPFMANGRAKAMDETDGFIKIIAHEKTDLVLGVHILGPRASELIAEAVAVMEYGGSSEDIARTCHAHPTLPEAMKEAALAVDRRALHF